MQHGGESSSMLPADCILKFGYAKSSLEDIATGSTMDVRLDQAFENSSTESHSPSGRLLSPLRIPSPFDLDI